MYKKTFFQYLLIAGLIGTLIIFFIISSLSKESGTKKKDLAQNLLQKNKIQNISKNTHLSLPSPSNTPTPTPTITPAPVPAGYCLNVPVLYYHHVQPLAIAKDHGNTNLTVENNLFDAQMQYIVSHGYTTITAQQLVDALKNHTTLPSKSIVITLDDGYEDNYTYAYPVFQKYHLNATIMLATGLLNFGGDYLSWEQIVEMQKSGIINYTDHTWSHYAVNHGTNEKIQYEILTAKQQIESHTGQTTTLFTYPYGSFNNNSITLLRQDGFYGAFSTLPGTLQCDSYIMSLHRTRIGNAHLSLYGL